MTRVLKRGDVYAICDRDFAVVDVVLDVDCAANRVVVMRILEKGERFDVLYADSYERALSDPFYSYKRIHRT